MKGDVALEEVDEVLEVKVKLVVYVLGIACEVDDIQLLKTDERSELVVNDSLKLDADVKLSGDDLVDEVVHLVRGIDVFAVDVNEIA